MKKAERRSERYTGVYVSRDGKKWIAKIHAYGKRELLGFFPLTPEGEVKAANAYDCGAIKFMGPNATTNFPKERHTSN